MKQNNEDAHNAPKDGSAGSVVKSVLAALLGVQAEENRVKDFRFGKASDFILVGCVGVFVLIGVMFALVRWVVASSSG